MRDPQHDAFSQVIGMSQAERQAHIEHYRLRTRELRALCRSFSEKESPEIAQIWTRIASCERMVALLQEPLLPDAKSH